MKLKQDTPSRCLYNDAEITFKAYTGVIPELVLYVKDTVESI